jgi:hypothetical protein
VPAPELLLTGIAGLALSHGKDLQDTVKENRVPKVTTDTRTGWTVRFQKLSLSVPICPWIGTASFCEAPGTFVRTHQELRFHAH